MVPNYMISARMLIRTEGGKIESVVGRFSQIQGVKTAFPILGRYDVDVDIEAEDYEQLGKAILKANRQSGIVFTETLPEVDS